MRTSGAERTSASPTQDPRGGPAQAPMLRGPAGHLQRSLLTMQRLAGNQAATRYIQRSKESATELPPQTTYQQAPSSPSM